MLRDEYFAPSFQKDEGVTKTLAEAYLYLVLNPDVPNRLSKVLLLSPSQLNLGSGNNSKPMFAADATYWQTVHANWVYPDIIINKEGSATEVREKELFQRIYDLEALAQLLRANNEKLSGRNGRLENEVLRLRSSQNEVRFDRTLKEEEREPWEVAAGKYGLDPQTLNAKNAKAAVNAYRRMYAQENAEALTKNDKAAGERLKIINADLDLIEKHFDI